jgi:hypothetical protein
MTQIHFAVAALMHNAGTQEPTPKAVPTAALSLMEKKIAPLPAFR